MRLPSFVLIASTLALLTAQCTPKPAGTGVLVPGGEAGIGFDDLRYSRALHRVLAPGGRAGVLALIEPENGAVTSVGGFSAAASFEGGHDFGVTSVDEGGGFIFVTDRTTQKVHAIDAKSRAIVATVGLAASPDYVRWVEPKHELWVTEPDGAQLEIFSVSQDSPPKLEHAAAIPIANGPESLVIDAARGRAYTHRWQATTVALDLEKRAIVGEWQNGCAASRGIDVEPEHGWVITSCSEGTATVADPATGKQLSSIARGSGYDVLGYNPTLRHVYLAGSSCACLTTLGLAGDGTLSFLGRSDAPGDTHCVVADDVGAAWLCSPKTGEVRKVSDAFPATR